MRRLLGKISGFLSNRTMVGVDKTGNKYFTRNEEVDGISKCLSFHSLSLYTLFMLLLLLSLWFCVLLCFEILSLYMCSLPCMNFLCHIRLKGLFFALQWLAHCQHFTHTIYLIFLICFAFFFCWCGYEPKRFSVSQGGWSSGHQASLQDKNVYRSGV